MGELKACCCHVLFQVFHRRGSGNWQNHLGPLEQPRQSDLQGAYLKILSDLLYDVVRLLRLSEGSPGEKSNAMLLAVVNNEVGLAVGKAVAILDRNDRNNPEGALNVLTGHVRESDVANLTLLAQLGQSFE